MKHFYNREECEMRAERAGVKIYEVCCYCGLAHKSVEAGGMWSCPNDLCTGPGAAGFRRELKSYHDEGNTHTIDPDEWLGEVYKKLYLGEYEEAIEEHIRKRIPDFMEWGRE